MRRPPRRGRRHGASLVCIANCRADSGGGFRYRAAPKAAEHLDWRDAALEHPLLRMFAEEDGGAACNRRLASAHQQRSSVEPEMNAAKQQKAPQRNAYGA